MSKWVGCPLFRARGRRRSGSRDHLVTRRSIAWRWCPGDRWGEQVDALHREARRKRVARVVETKVPNRRRIDCLREVFLGPVVVGIPVDVREHECRGGERPGASREERPDLGRHGHVAGLAMLAPRDGEHARLEVQILPLCAQVSLEAKCLDNLRRELRQLSS